MNERFQKWLDNFKDYLASLSTTKKVTIAALSAVVTLGVVAAVLVAKNNPYEKLYSELSPEDATAVAKKLSELKIPYQMAQDQQSVLVPKDQVDIARMELAKDGLPGEDVVGFETFDNFSFGTSSYVQRIQYLRAVQGELTRSIQRIAAVKRARVHLSVPPKKVFLEEQEAPKASVVLELKRGKDLTKAELKGIAHIVSSAIEGMNADQVTIVDASGKFLHRPTQGDQTELSQQMLEMQRSIESTYETRIEELLGPVVGHGKVIAKVTAELDNSRVAMTEESFEGDQAPKSITKNSEVTSGSRPNPMGIPGSRSNLPGSETDEPAVPMSTTSSEKTVNNTEFHTPKKVQTINKPSGSIKRLTVAVLVDGKYEKDDVGAMKYAPRAPEEIVRIKDMVSNAVGLDNSRRDSLTVESMEFSGNTLMPQETAPTAIQWQDFIKDAIKNGLIGLVVVLFFMLVLRPFLKWATLSDLEKEVSQLPKTVAELEAAQKEQGVQELVQAVQVLDAANPSNAELQAGQPQMTEEEQLQKDLLEKLEKSPKKALTILDDWMKDDKIPENSDEFVAEAA